MDRLVDPGATKRKATAASIRPSVFAPPRLSLLPLLPPSRVSQTGPLPEPMIALHTLLWYQGGGAPRIASRDSGGARAREGASTLTRRARGLGRRRQAGHRSVDHGQAEGW
jgi:hypothetical protein